MSKPPAQIDKIMDVLRGKGWVSREQTIAELGQSDITVLQFDRSVYYAKYRRGGSETIEKKVEDGQHFLLVRERTDQEKERIATNVVRERRSYKRGPKAPPDHSAAIPKRMENRVVRQDSDLIEVSAADREWLESLPLRSRVVAHRFDEDAILYRRFSAVFHQFGEDLLKIIGGRSPRGASLIYLALHRISKIAPIEHWYVCPRCGGNGIDAGVCPSCRGGGYLIPGLSQRKHAR